MTDAWIKTWYPSMYKEQTLRMCAFMSGDVVKRIGSVASGEGQIQAAWA